MVLGPSTETSAVAETPAFSPLGGSREAMCAPAPADVGMRVGLGGDYD